MTGPVERVPLTDVVLDHWESEAKTAPLGHLGTVNWPAVAQMLIAELRASRAREVELLEAFRSASDSADEWCATEEKITAERDELQQRIDRLLAHCDQEEADDLAAQVGQYPGSFIETTKVRAALTGTEPTPNA